MGAPAAATSLRARAQLTAGAPARPGGPARLTWRRDAPPVAWRPTADAVYLVGTAASPVGSDEVDVEVTVEEGASLSVRSAASAVAWSSSGARTAYSVDVGTGAALDWQLQPLVATGRCRLQQHVSLQLATGAALRWCDEVVLGRHGEPPGDICLRLDLIYDGRPLLRHQVGIGPSYPGWDSPAVCGDARALVTELLVLATGTAAQLSPGAGPGWALMPLEGPGVFAQAVGDDLAQARQRMALARASWP